MEDDGRKRGPGESGQWIKLGAVVLLATGALRAQRASGPFWRQNFWFVAVVCGMLWLTSGGN